MADRDLPADLGSQGGQLRFPEPELGAVAATPIGTDQQPIGFGEGDLEVAAPPVLRPTS
jgi:hypothetical protein